MAAISRGLVEAATARIYAGPYLTELLRSRLSAAIGKIIRMSANRICAQWPSDKWDICARLRATKSKLKIVLKTKDEKLFLPHWIKHHANIVEPSNLIIVDNMSVNEEVIRLYDALPSECILFQYDGAVNDLHHVELFRDLYDAIRISSRYYTVIDTDEFLYFLHEGRMIADHTLSAQLSAGSDGVFPGFWLQNFPGQTNMFFIKRIDENLQWGKPVIPSSLPVRGYINHSIQMFFNCGPFPIRFGVFIAHLKRLDPVQRIEANLRKLKSLGYLPAETSVENLDLEAIELYHGTNTAAELFREIAQFSRVASTGWPPVAAVPSGCLQIQSDGTLAFGDKAAQAAFESILERYSSQGIELLSRPPLFE